MKKMINWAAVVMVALTMSIGCGGDDTISVSDEDAAKMQQMSEAMAGDGGTMTETGDVADPGTEGEEGGEEAAEGGEE